MTPRGSAIWVALAALLAAGFFGSVLARCRVGRGEAAGWSLAVGIGSFTSVAAVNVGAALAAGWAVLLLCRGARAEAVRALTAATAGATVLYALAPGPWLPPLAAATPMLTGVAAGLAIYFVGGSQRGAIAAVLFTAPLAGLAGWTTARALGMPGSAPIGGGGTYDAQAVALLVAVALGEATARLRRTAGAGRPRDAARTREGPEEAGGGLT